eukprot:m.143141 g.143141  ORF g.143141 m.143141 type:complete len:63 (+) comp14082_c0_seq13:2190-2378(+)
MSIMGQFDDSEVEFTSESTRGISGFFEVSVNDKLVFSKDKSRHFPYAEDLEAINAAIEAALA